MPCCSVSKTLKLSYKRISFHLSYLWKSFIRGITSFDISPVLHQEHSPWVWYNIFIFSIIKCSCKIGAQNVRSSWKTRFSDGLCCSWQNTASLHCHKHQWWIIQDEGQEKESITDKKKRWKEWVKSYMGGSILFRRFCTNLDRRLHSSFSCSISLYFGSKV